MNNVAIIILHYKDTENTRACLESIYENGNFESGYNVIISANTSLTENFSKKKNYPYELLPYRENLGFSGGINRALQHAQKTGFRYALLLNNDTVLGQNMVPQLVWAAAKNPSYGLLSPKIYFSPGFEYHLDRYELSQRGRIIWYAGGLIDWRNVYASHRGVDQVDTGQYGKECDTDFATGCCLLVPNEVVKKVGYFDDKYFLYYEDIDYSLRVKKSGYRVIYQPDAFLWHKNAASSGKPGSDLHLYYQTRNRLYFGNKYAGLRAKKSLFLESFKLLGKGKIYQKAIFDYYLGRMGRRNYAG